jgi:hypothetical protein
VGLEELAVRLNRKVGNWPKDGLVATLVDSVVALLERLEFEGIIR